MTSTPLRTVNVRASPWDALKQGWSEYNRGMQYAIYLPYPYQDVVARTAHGFGDLYDLSVLDEVNIAAAFHSMPGLERVAPLRGFEMAADQWFVLYERMSTDRSLEGSARDTVIRGMIRARAMMDHLHPAYVGPLFEDACAEVEYQGRPGLEFPLRVDPGRIGDHAAHYEAVMYRVADIALSRFGPDMLHALGLPLPDELHAILDGKLPSSALAAEMVLAHCDMKPANSGEIATWTFMTDQDLAGIASRKHAAAHDEAILVRRTPGFRHLFLTGHLRDYWRAHIPGAVDAHREDLVRKYGYLEDGRSMYLDLLRATELDHKGNWRVSPEVAYVALSRFCRSLRLPLLPEEEYIRLIKEWRRDMGPGQMVRAPEQRVRRERHTWIEMGIERAKARHPRLYSPEYVWVPPLAPLETVHAALARPGVKEVLMGVPKVDLGPAEAWPDEEHSVLRTIPTPAFEYDVAGAHRESAAIRAVTAATGFGRPHGRIAGKRVAAESAPRRGRASVRARRGHQGPRRDP